MASHTPSHEPDEHGGIDHDRVAEQGLAGEGRQHLGDDPHRREDEDVDLRVTEQPEEVLPTRSEEHTSELQSPCNLVCRLLLEKKKKTNEASETGNWINR